MAQKPQPAAVPPVPSPSGAVKPATPAAAPRSADVKPIQPAQPKPQAQPKPAQPKPVRPPARQARFQLRHMLVLLSFVVCVVLPGAVTGFYLWRVAVDQYASKVGFSVRREDANSAMEILGGLTTLSNSSSSDTDILFEFIQSQKLVTDLDAEVDLHDKWSRPQDDFIFALPKDASIEDLVDYWNDMVNISYGAGAGLIEVEVRAFTAADATQIAQALLERSSEMINDLSDIARQDAIRYAKEELDEAVERLKEARAIITQFRNKNQIVNPETDIQSQAGLLANLQGQQAETLIEIDLLEETVNDSDPRLEQSRRRLRVIETRIAAERQKLGFGTSADTGTAFADLVGDYERLVVDREFAEKSYVSALATYDSALAESRRKSRYLAAYMQPTMAQTPQYPQRIMILSLITLFAFLAWATLVLIAYSVKDRR